MPRAFNLRRFERTAADIPNGTSISTVPNGSNLPQGGVMLSPGGDPSMAGGATGGGKTPLRDILGDILLKKDQGASGEEISAVAKQALNADIPPNILAANDDLAKGIAALGRRASEDPQKISRNLSTGEVEGDLGDLVEGLVSDISDIDPTWDVQTLIKEAKERQGSSMRTAAKRQDPEEQKKKKTSGNPFRVLMGLIGKMLDHGMPKGEIVRKVLKQPKTSWQRETVQKCVDIVKDYSRREHRKKTEEATMAANTFNPRRYAQRQLAVRGGEQSRPSVYDVTRDTGLMSTTELLMREAYLTDAKKGLGPNENNPGNHTIDTAKLKKDSKAIETELNKRGIGEEERKSLNGVAEQPDDKTVGDEE